MDVQNVAKKLGITNVAVVRKAEEYARLCKVRCPQGLGAVRLLSSPSSLSFLSFFPLLFSQLFLFLFFLT